MSRGASDSEMALIAAMYTGEDQERLVDRAAVARGDTIVRRLPLSSLLPSNLDGA